MENSKVSQRMMPFRHWFPGGGLWFPREAESGVRVYWEVESGSGIKQKRCVYSMRLSVVLGGLFVCDDFVFIVA